MDGKTLSRDLAQLILEDPDTSGFLKPRVSYGLLWRAAVELARRLRYPRAEGTVTTVASQRDGYKLPADFLCLYLKDSRDDYFVRYYTGTAYSNLKMLEEAAVFEDYNTTNQATPGGFVIADYRTALSNVTGTATSAGAASAGQSTLTDAAASFSSSVSVGDTIHNTTDGSTGYVLSVTSNTAVVVTLFDGSDNNWTQDDAYVIVPQRRYQLAFDAPAATAGHVVTIPYVARPAPVFSNYGTYPFPIDLSWALVSYAAWLYKYRDSSPDFGDKWWKIFDRDTRLSAASLSASQGTKRVKVIMKVR